jgi:hypothetical protein
MAIFLYFILTLIPLYDTTCIMILERFEQRDITRILGIKRPALQQWIERGFVSPSIEKAGALGRRNVWSRADMFMLGAFHELIKRGFSREEAGRFLKKHKVIRAWGKKAEETKWSQEDKDLGPDWETVLGVEYHAVQILVGEETQENGSIERHSITRHSIHFILEAQNNKFFPAFAKAAKMLSLDKFTIRTMKTVNLTKARKNVASKLE